jgi:hypothetical protein
MVANCHEKYREKRKDDRENEKVQRLGETEVKVNYESRVGGGRRLHLA